MYSDYFNYWFENLTKIEGYGYCLNILMQIIQVPPRIMYAKIIFTKSQTQSHPLTQYCAYIECSPYDVWTSLLTDMDFNMQIS